MPRLVDAEIHIRSPLLVSVERYAGIGISVIDGYTVILNQSRVDVAGLVLLSGSVRNLVCANGPVSNGRDRFHMDSFSDVRLVEVRLEETGIEALYWTRGRQ